MGGRKFFLRLILIIFFVSGKNGQETITDELTTTFSQEVTTVLNQEDVPIREAPFPFQFPRDKKPSGISTRIVGGNVATANAYPYQVALYIAVNGSLYFCGGTLITTEWVLTAAHCVDGASSVLVILGAHDISQAEATWVTYNTTTFMIHEDWNSTILQNDIALIRLPQNVTLNNNIRTVHVAQGTHSYSGILGRCLGWGKTILGFLSNVLRYIDAEILSNENCSSYEDYTPIIVDHHLCTSGAGNIGSCNGDSGGPLIVHGTQVGIVSFGVTDCAAGLPSVFTRVTKFDSWFAENIENWSDYSNGGNRGRLSPLMLAYGGIILGVMFFNCL